MNNLGLNLGNAINALNNLKPVHVTSIEQNLASEFCKKIYNHILEFDSKIDSDKQVAVRLVSFG